MNESAKRPRVLVRSMAQNLLYLVRLRGKQTASDWAGVSLHVVRAERRCKSLSAYKKRHGPKGSPNFTASSAMS